MLGFLLRAQSLVIMYEFLKTECQREASIHVNKGAVEGKDYAYYLVS